ncbi:hypothetical protein BR93DRAFT_209624 [Coniochaeta sp. PMI_546]|nr:hypothetical protein BR93DRAFT_209624 [Coniochaeta sp. PMI_546]
MQPGKRNVCGLSALNDTQGRSNSGYRTVGLSWMRMLAIKGEIEANAVDGDGGVGGVGRRETRVEKIECQFVSLSKRAYCGRKSQAPPLNSMDVWPFSTFLTPFLSVPQIVYIRYLH